ncbi:MAG: hypothetical protein IT317_05280 [Anaerolineales bacterium]|nr:hypothetical protein [Anaerolineales bacterium]
MFAVINHLHLDVSVDELAPRIQTEGFPMLAQLKGCIATYLNKEAADRCCVIILWETPADAQAGAAAFGPTWFHANIAAHLASEQNRTAGPVVAQRS